MKYFIASDHAGKNLRKFTKELLEKKGIEVVDLGCEEDRVDYPDFANKLCEAVLANEGAKGVLICGSGIGMSMAANRHKGIRAALCHNAYTAAAARAHNDANVLCMGERALGLGTAEAVVEAWLCASFEGGRHLDRINKF
ncbi:MAG: ribose 5-phosphate isomerase B [Campylobacterales bacterium]|nr:ribose 5-phosphate isomerase B [Campylobacterales bacterium]